MGDIKMTIYELSPDKVDANINPQNNNTDEIWEDVLSVIRKMDTEVEQETLSLSECLEVALNQQLLDTNENKAVTSKSVFDKVSLINEKLEINESMAHPECYEEKLTVQKESLEVKP